MGSSDLEIAKEYIEKMDYKDEYPIKNDGRQNYWRPFLINGYYKCRNDY
jgi:hypothetical protein